MTTPSLDAIPRASPMPVRDGSNILRSVAETSFPLLLTIAAREPIANGSRLRLIWGYRRKADAIQSALIVLGSLEYGVNLGFGEAGPV